MELYEEELADAHRRIQARGREPGDFFFRMEYLPPDPDGGGMFTVQYEVTITSARSPKALVTVGGIGMGWVDRFASQLDAGYFD